MGLKFKVFKNKIIPTLLIMTAVMILISAVSALFLANTAVLSMTRDCSVFDSSMDKLAVLEQKDIEQKRKLLYIYAQLLKDANQTDEDAILNIFYDLENNIERNDFNALVLVMNDDSFITYHNSFFGKEQLKHVKSALNGKKKGDPDDLYIGTAQNNMSYFAVPVAFSNKQSGYLIGMLPSDSTLSSYKNPLKMYDSSVYLLNSENQVVFYLGEQGRDFSYKELDHSQFYDSSKNYNYQMSLLLNSISKKNRKTVLKVAGVESYDKTNINKNLKDVELLFFNSDNTWYEKPVQVGTVEWKLVAGKMTSISAESLSLITGGAILVAFVILTSFIMMVILVISQGTSNKKLMKLAYLDIITGSHNWTHFQLESRRLFRRKNKSASYMLISMDIRKFRVLSEVNGELKSDTILKYVSDALKKQMQPKETFCRFAVDEFALLINCESEQQAIERVNLIDSTLKSMVPVLNIHFCYGIFPISDYTVPIRKMYNFAGIARDLAKKRREEIAVFFDNSMWESMVREKDLEGSMEEALKNHEFQVYLQPKYSADGAYVGGAEALVRWVSPKFGFVSPGDFIPLFEKNGFIMKLDTYMLDRVCEIQKKWMKQGHKLVTISVNISRVHLLDPILVEEITTTISSYGIPTNCIELELTESAFFEDKKVLLNTVNQLRNAGFCISMDDFGTGYSSLNSLKDLPLDIIKLDCEFFNYSSDRERSETVIKDTISLAKDLNMKIVAEGIETKEQVEFLHDLGCDYIQGFYFAKPMPVTDFETLMNY